MPEAVLAGAYTAHLLATVIWIGGLAALVALPGIAARLSESDRLRAVDDARLRFQPYAWICVAVFAGSGLVQMSASPRYEGLLALGNLWSAAILVKHLLVGAMVVILAILTWRLHPELARLRLGWTPAEPGRADRLRRRASTLERISLGLGGLVLVLTAIARVAA